MIAICAVCRKPAEAFKFFRSGPACRSCVLQATEIAAVYTIHGMTYEEGLKVPMPPRAEPIPIARGRKKP